MKKKVFLCAAVCALILTATSGCSLWGEKTEQTSSTPASAAESAVQNQETSEPESATPSNTLSNTQPEEKNETISLYIGTNGNFKTYAYPFSAAPTPEAVIAAIAETSGWKLPVTEVTTSGRGGYIISFAKSGTLFTGNASAKAEFATENKQQLFQNILDSVQKTLQTVFAQESMGEPELKIFYRDETGAPLTFSDLGITIPVEQAYSPNMWEYLSNQNAQG